LLLLTITTHLKTFAIATTLAACAFMVYEVSTLNSSSIQFSFINV
jgi:hypothetical protein